MRKNLLFPLLLALVAVIGVNQTKAQAPCVVDLQYNAPGIFPSDTLPDMFVGTAVNDVVQFIFPPDTTLFGVTLPFDSFVVSSVSNVPAGLSWACDQNMNGCVYLTTPGQLTRGCVAITGTPNGATASYPLYDSIIVAGDGWVTVPVVGAQSAATDIPIYFRITTGTSIEAPLVQNLNLNVAPSPAQYMTKISYNVSEVADVNVSIVNTLGQRVLNVANEQGAQGQYEIPVNLADLPAGIYYVRVELNGGEHVKTKKFSAIR